MFARPLILSIILVIERCEKFQGLGQARVYTDGGLYKQTILCSFSYNSHHIKDVDKARFNLYLKISRTLHV